MVHRTAGASGIIEIVFWHAKMVLDGERKATIDALTKTFRKSYWLIKLII